MAEEQHQIGLEYLHKFGAILTANLHHSDFKITFNAYENSNKMRFKTQNNKEVNFDLKGYMKYDNQLRDVWIESKGYSKGSSLKSEYQKFIARSFFVWNQDEQYREDIFIFVTNVPFGVTEGKGLADKKFIRKSILDHGNECFEDIEKVEDLDDKIYDFYKNIFPIILTDSYIKLISKQFSISRGQTLWDIWRGRENVNLKWEQFEALMKLLNPSKNNLNSLRVGEVLNIPSSL